VRVTRAEARLRQIDRIKSTSRRLMAEKGAPGLSLREVAREMGVVSSPCTDTFRPAMTF